MSQQGEFLGAKSTCIVFTSTTDLARLKYQITQMVLKERRFRVMLSHKVTEHYYLP